MKFGRNDKDPLSLSEVLKGNLLFFFGEVERIRILIGVGGCWWGLWETRGVHGKKGYNGIRKILIRFFGCVACLSLGSKLCEQ